MAKGLNEMEIESEFLGKAKYKAVLLKAPQNRSSSQNGSAQFLDFKVDQVDQYEGDYSIQRKVLFQGVPKYDHPHLRLGQLPPP